jgi:hypothetical protein
MCMSARSSRIKRWKRTAFAELYFFSVARMAPERAAALMADLPLMTFPWSPPPAPPLALLPIRVTVSQSWSAMLNLWEGLVEVACSVKG